MRYAHTCVHARTHAGTNLLRRPCLCLRLCMLIFFFVSSARLCVFQNELEFQQLRRGRYVEFNLVYDKGTTYGLRQPGARVDAVLMSMPPLARFAYRRPANDQREVYTQDALMNPKDW